MAHDTVGTRRWAPITHQSDEEILAGMTTAMDREARDRVRGLRATHVQYDSNHETVFVQLTNGLVVGFPVTSLPPLAAASQVQRARLELSPSGAIILWPELDLDVSVPGIVHLVKETLDESEAEPWRGVSAGEGPRIVGHVRPVSERSGMTVNPNDLYALRQHELYVLEFQRRLEMMPERGDSITVLMLKRLIRLLRR